MATLKNTFIAKSGRFTILTWLYLLVIGLSVSACRSEARPGTLAGYVQAAKREGKTSTSFLRAQEAGEGNLADILRKYSVVVANPVRVAVAQTVDEISINTWTVFREVEVLVSRVPTAGACSLRIPPTVHLEPGEVAVPRAGGSVTIDGVKLTMESNEWLPDDLARTYVLVVVKCPNGLEYLALPMLGQGILEVRPDGRLVAALGARFDFQKEMEAIGTVGGLKDYLRFIEPK